MKTCLDCLPCFLRQSLDAVRVIGHDVTFQSKIMGGMLEELARFDLERSPPAAAQLLQRHLRALSGNSDPYQAVKRRSNELALAALPKLRDLVRASADPLHMAATLAVVANAIDVGANPSLTEAEVGAALSGSTAQPEGDWAAFSERAQRAKRILYLTDNAGEIAVDRLVIEELGPQRVTVAVRGAPVLNDATMEDAVAVGLTELTTVIDNGSDAPGTLLDDCSLVFREHFARAELVIAKGQGNYESLDGNDPRTAFWFKVKCPMVAQLSGLPLGTLALLPPSSVLG